jgi:UDP-N-acetylmuramate: L-alanyl-gamma-D-glutamyl-meso-diaminopimelate ligase
MHVHILGICGTFMAGVAMIAREAGHRVSGSDRNVYPPMSTQLEAAGIEIHSGYDAAQLERAPDVVVVGNVMSRGQPVIEALLESHIPYVSGPQWLAEHVLRDRWVLAVAGTHGKTTTSSMLAWILEFAGLSPGFLIGGMPRNFGESARLGRAPFFVIEADEYDTAFFDKRAKFVHYRPRTLVLNNLEFDHADIYPDVTAIERQFHHLIRTVPGSGLIVRHAKDIGVANALALGSWTATEEFSLTSNEVAERVEATEGVGPTEGGWSARIAGAAHGGGGGDGSRFEVLLAGAPLGHVAWDLIGVHNVENALAAIAAARHAGVPVDIACAALCSFEGIKRRLELRGEAAGVCVYDDFAHHPTAIATTLNGLRRKVGRSRIVAVLEPRSNTMRLGVHRDQLATSLNEADEVWVYAPPQLEWDVAAALSACRVPVEVMRDVDVLVRELSARLQPGDHALMMSNGSFDGLHEKLLAALQARAATGEA